MTMTVILMAQSCLKHMGEDCESAAVSPVIAVWKEHCHQVLLSCQHKWLEALHTPLMSHPCCTRAGKMVAGARLGSSGLGRNRDRLEVKRRWTLVAAACTKYFPDPGLHPDSPQTYISKSTDMGPCRPIDIQAAYRKVLIKYFYLPLPWCLGSTFPHHSMQCTSCRWHCMLWIGQGMRLGCKSMSSLHHCNNANGRRGKTKLGYGEGKT